MKAIIEFDLEDPSDKLSHRRCINATNAYIAMHEFDNLLRKYIKHSYGIEEGAEWALPLGYHVLTREESELIWHVIKHISTEYQDILENLKIDLEDLE
jgi:hypothetical protein